MKKKEGVKQSSFCKSKLLAVSFLGDKKKRKKYTRNVRRFPRVACPLSFSRVGEYFARSCLSQNHQNYSQSKEKSFIV